VLTLCSVFYLPFTPQVIRGGEGSSIECLAWARAASDSSSDSEDSDADEDEDMSDAMGIRGKNGGSMRRRPAASGGDAGDGGPEFLPKFNVARLFSAGLSSEIIEWDLVRLQPKVRAPQAKTPLSSLDVGLDSGLTVEGFFPPVLSF
jgi:hypothetical protein